MAARIITAGSTEHRNYKLIVGGLGVLAFILFAFAYIDTASLEIAGNKYNLSIIRVNKAIAFAIAILGLQVIVGYTGQLALGQSFFFGMGAYITAWLVADHSWPYLLTLIVVVPACFIVGMILGIPALRVKGLYLALITLGLAAVFPSLVKLDALSDYTNGAGGKSVSESKLIPPGWLGGGVDAPRGTISNLDRFAEFLQTFPVVGGFFGDGPLSSREEERMWKLILLTLMLVACCWLVSNLIQSRPGRAMRAVRDNETGAAVSGINLASTKTLAFGVASALGGVGGTAYVMEVGIASPDDFAQVIAILFIVGLVVGGVGTISGAIVGAFVIVFVPDWSSSTQELPIVPERWLQGPTGSLILGAGLILLTFVLPGGIVAAYRRLKARFIQIVPGVPTMPSMAAAAEAAIDTTGVDTPTAQEPTGV